MRACFDGTSMCRAMNSFSKDQDVGAGAASTAEMPTLPPYPLAFGSYEEHQDQAMHALGSDIAIQTDGLNAEALDIQSKSTRIIAIHT